VNRINKEVFMRDHFKAVMPVLLAVLVGCPTKPDPVVPPPTGSTDTLLGTVIVVGNERYDFNADTSTPDNPLAGASFTRQTGTGVVLARKMLRFESECFHDPVLITETRASNRHTRRGGLEHHTFGWRRRLRHALENGVGTV
jgi:hypothetical protein